MKTGGVEMQVLSQKVWSQELWKVLDDSFNSLCKVAGRLSFSEKDAGETYKIPREKAVLTNLLGLFYFLGWTHAYPV